MNVCPRFIIYYILNYLPETTNGSRAPVNSFKKKTVFKTFQKFEIKILVVDNFEIYNPAKYQLKI
jgi:hypothetical protein